MPSIRSARAPVRPPRHRNQELDPYTRTRICELKNTAGWSYKQIQQEYPTIPKSTIQSTIRREAQRVDNHSIARSGRPRKLSEEDRDRILEAIHGNPRITREDLLATVDYKVKKDSIRRLLNVEGLRKWRCLNRPYLTEEHAAKRLQWARTYEHYTPED
jgi:transposase